MKVSSNRVAGGALILLGFIWLASLFVPKPWINRTANQIQPNNSNPAGTQQFSAPNAGSPLAETNQDAVNQPTNDAQSTAQTPQTTASPDQSQPSASPTPSPNPTPPFETTPQPTPQPSPAVVPNPVNAGW